MSLGAQWSDLAARLGSGALMLVVGLTAVWMGGDAFHAFVAVVTGLMIWELVRIVSPDAPGTAVRLGLLAGVVAMVAIYVPPAFALPMLLAPAMVGLSEVKQNRTLYIVFAVMVLLAGFGMMSVRDDYGFKWMLWLAAVVVATDVAGYFAGRMLGGPKFWPRVSPKKTWAGTSAGWIAAAIIGLIFSLNTQIDLGLIGISVAVSMASQIGDIAESAVKRKMGVKDSSNLIPGHGGVLDRFDGMLGASVFLLVTGPMIGFPPGLS